MNPCVMSYPGKLILMLWVSGAGKGTIIKELLKKDLWLTQVMSYTTRPMRPDETQDIHYHYGMTESEFQQAIDAWEFLEYAKPHRTNLYGTKKKDVIEKLQAGEYILKELNIDGIVSVSQHPDVREVTKSIFLDIDNETMKYRIQNRAALAWTTISEEDLVKRLESAERERDLAKKYCTIIVDGTGTIEEETERVANIIQKFLNEDQSDSIPNPA